MISPPTAAHEQDPRAQAVEAVRRLAAGLAHDLNNLLTVISGNVELLQADHQAKGTRVVELEEVAHAARRAANLTHQLLAYSRQQHLQLGPVDVGALLRGQREALRRIAGLRVTVEASHDRDVAPVMADAGQLATVLHHLVANARDAMPAGGPVRISASNVEVDAVRSAAHPPLPPGRYVLLSVSDVGVGMDPATLARAFDPFFTTRPHRQGAGMGLATVYGIVKQGGGFIFADSAVGQGTVMRLYLPRAVKVAPVAPRAALAPARPPGPRTVLVVEDEVLVRSFARRTLEREGFRVYDAANAHEALAAARALGDALDVLLTDIVMPGMGGVELARAIAADFPQVAVILMSGYAREGDAAGHRGEPRAFLRKPFSVEELRACVRAAVGEPVAAHPGA